MRNSRSVFSTSSSLSFADRSENSQAPLLPIRPFFQTLHEVDSAKENSMSAEAARRAPLMSLGELVRAYRLHAGEFGRPVALSAFALSPAENERLYLLFDQDYLVSPFFCFKDL